MTDIQAKTKNGRGMPARKAYLIPMSLRKRSDHGLIGSSGSHTYVYISLSRRCKVNGECVPSSVI